MAPDPDAEVGADPSEEREHQGKERRHDERGDEAGDSGHRFAGDVDRVGTEQGQYAKENDHWPEHRSRPDEDELEERTGLSSSDGRGMPRCGGRQSLHEVTPKYEAVAFVTPGIGVCISLLEWLEGPIGDARAAKGRQT